jgi:hypothetical protein
VDNPIILKPGNSVKICLVFTAETHLVTFRLLQRVQQFLTSITHRVIIAGVMMRCVMMARRRSETFRRGLVWSWGGFRPVCSSNGEWAGLDTKLQEVR